MNFSLTKSAPSSLPPPPPPLFLILCNICADENFYEIEETLKHDSGQLLTAEGIEHSWKTRFDIQYTPRLTCILAPYELPFANWESKDERPNLFFCPEEVAALWLHSLFRQAEKALDAVRKECEKQGIRGLWWDIYM